MTRVGADMPRITELLRNGASAHSLPIDSTTIVPKSRGYLVYFHLCVKNDAGQGAVVGGIPLALYRAWPKHLTALFFTMNCSQATERH